MSALIQLTLDGSFVHNGHKVSLRVLSHTMASIQSAADRAFLDVKFGNVAKHQRLPQEFYQDADFIVGDPQEGSYLIDFVSRSGEAIVRRMREALQDPYAKALAGGDLEAYTISHQITGKKEQIHRGVVVPVPFEEFSNESANLITRTYGDKSINKEFDQMLSSVRRNANSHLRLVLKPSVREPAQTFEFDQEIAKCFKSVLAKRELGEPLVYTGILRSLDHGHNRNWNLKGKFINSENDKNLVLNKIGRAHV